MLKWDLAAPSGSRAHPPRSSQETAVVYRLFLLLILLVLPAPRVAAQETSAPPDTALARAPVDSLSAPAPPDSTARAAITAVTDSTALAQADSSANRPAGGMVGLKEAVGGSLDPMLDLGPLLPPWTEAATLGPRAMERLRARGVDELAEAVPVSYLRVSGDRAFPGYYDLTPIDGATVESFVDGIPTRSPADMDPGIWDISAMGTGYVSRSPRDMGGSMGGSALDLERKPAEWGTTLLRGYFDKSKYESYLRGISATTPRAPRTFRLDYEEWKTEEGYNISDNPSLGATPGYGSAKMRRFVFSVGINTGVGRVSMGFGRGRRYYTGTMDNGGAVDRWTGQVWAGVDREGDASHLRVRGYHLDWHDDDTIHAEERDASRLGLRVLWSARGGGPSLAFDFERWAARFLGAAQAASPPARHLGRLRLGWAAQREAALRWQLSAEAAYAEQASTPWGGAGEASVRWLPRHTWWLGAEAGSQVRSPTLLETSGFQSFDLAGGFTLRRQAGGDLPFEQRKRVRVFVGVPIRTHGQIELSAERWELHAGIGWVPEINAAVDGNAYTVGGLGYTLDQIALRVAMPLGDSHHGLSVDGGGHWVLGDLPRDASRGAGWPEKGAFFTARWWHDLLTERDQVRLLYRVSFQGAHYDDLLAPFSSPSDLLDPTLRQDFRIALRLRDAEVFVEAHNFIGATIEQVAGTQRRPRDLIWGLYWPFWN
jgi:hypothetical protein